MVIHSDMILHQSRDAVNLINDKCARFLYECLFSCYVLALNKLSYEKIVCKNVDEIDILGQFHPHFTHSFYACRAQKRKNTVRLYIFLALLRSCAHKIWAQNIGEIDPCLTCLSLSIDLYHSRCFETLSQLFLTSMENKLS